MVEGKTVLGFIYFFNLFFILLLWSNILIRVTEEEKGLF